MAVGVASILALVGIVMGILGFLFADLLVLTLSVAFFGIAIVTVDAEMSEIRERLTAAGGGPRHGWAPTCPACGLDITGRETVCPHCGRAIAPASPVTS